MKSKTFWIVLASTAVVWAANYAYAYKHKLERPVFLNHYVDLWQHTDMPLTMYYITNKSDTSEIQYAELGGKRIFPDRFSAGGFEEVDQFGSYSLRRVEFLIDEPPPEAAGDVYSSMLVVFTEYPQAEYEIGAIAVRPEKMGDVPFTETSGFSGDYQETRMKVDESFTIGQVDFSAGELLNNGFFMKFNRSGLAADNEGIEMDKQWKVVKGADLRAGALPFSVEKGDWFTVSSYIDETLHSALFDAAVALQGETAAGKSFSSIVFHHQYPYVDLQSAKQLIEQRTGADAHE